MFDRILKSPRLALLWLGGLLAGTVGFVALLISTMDLFQGQAAGFTLQETRFMLSPIEMLAGLAFLIVGIAMLIILGGEIKQDFAASGGYESDPIAILGLVAIAFPAYLVILFPILPHLFKDPGEWLGGFARWIPVYFLAWCVVLGVHELGHAFAAMLVGYRFVSLKVFGFLIGRTKKGFRFDHAIGGYNRANLIPTRSEHVVRNHFLKLLGGPVATAAFAVFLAIVLRRWHLTISDAYAPPWGRPWLDNFTTILWLMNLLLLFHSLNPYRADFFSTDGFQICRLVFNRWHREATGVLGRFEVARGSGLRPKKWPLQDVAALRATYYPVEDSAKAGWILAWHYFDKRDLSKSLELAQWTAALCLQHVRREEACQAANFLAASLLARQGKLEEAKRHLKQGSHGFSFVPAMKLVATASVARADGRLKAGESFASQAQIELAHSLDPPWPVTEADVEFAQAYAKSLK